MPGDTDSQAFLDDERNLVPTVEDGKARHFGFHYTDRPFQARAYEPGGIGARPDDTGRVVKLRGSVSEYRGALQISVHRIRMAEAADDYDTALLVPTAPIDADAALADVQRLVASITDADYRSVAETMLAQKREAKLLPGTVTIGRPMVSASPAVECAP